MTRWILLSLLCLPPGALAAAGALPGLLDGYRSAGAGPFDAARGAEQWSRSWPAPDGGPARSCTSCHPTDHGRGGEHARTGMPIEPLSPTANPARLSDPAEVEKWLGRNCRWTLGRECTPQEKGDFLTFIAQ